MNGYTYGRAIVGKTSCCYFAFSLSDCKPSKRRRDTRFWVAFPSDSPVNKQSLLRFIAWERDIDQGSWFLGETIDGQLVKRQGFRIPLLYPDYAEPVELIEQKNLAWAKEAANRHELTGIFYNQEDLYNYYLP